MNNNKTISRDCELCDELEGRASRFTRIYQTSLEDRIVASTENFVALPSIGQIGDAHIMIVSKAHETSFAQLGAEMREEILGLLSLIRKWLEANIGQYIVVFENGDPTGGGRMGCTISHLHLHIIASRRALQNIDTAVLSLEGEQIQNLNSLPVINDSYSFIQLPNNYAHLIHYRLPSQTLRRIVAQEAGGANWDWRQAEREDNLISLVHNARVGLTQLHGQTIA